MKTIVTAISLLAGFLMFLLMLLTLLDVLGRNLLNIPFPGATELTEIMLALMSFLLFPIVALSDKNIIADLADSFNSRLLDEMKYLLTACLGCLFFAIISWRLWILGSNAAAYGDATPSLNIPLAPINYGVSILAGFASLVFLTKFALGVRRRSWLPGRSSDGATTEVI